MIKKVVIAAAGQGTRMLHLTKDKPKHLIRVLKRPFIFYLLNNIFKAGYKEIILVVGYKGEKFQEALKNYKLPSKNHKIRIINQFKILGEAEGKGKKGKYGTACPLMCVRDVVGEENFLMVAGGDFYLAKDLKAFNIDDNYNYIAGFYHKHPERFGVLLVDDKGFLKKIVEKPKKHLGNLINISLYKFTPEVFKKLSQIKKSPRGEYEITDVVSLLAKDKKVKVKILKDFWMDFGNPADVIKISKFLSKNGNYKNTAKKPSKDIKMPR